MRRAAWFEYFVDSRWPQAGFAVVDQHGHQHATCDTFREALDVIARLNDGQRKALEAEARRFP